MTSPGSWLIAAKIVRCRVSSLEAGEGARIWLVPDCYLPEQGAGELESHEAICVSFYFEDREPIRDRRLIVGSERTRHIRLDRPEEIGGAEVPQGVPYAARIQSDVPVSVQCSRLDTSQEALALMTVVAHAVG
jgi:hypothetical protein